MGSRRWRRRRVPRTHVGCSPRPAWPQETGRDGRDTRRTAHNPAIIVKPSESACAGCVPKPPSSAVALQVGACSRAVCKPVGSESAERKPPCAGTRRLDDTEPGRLVCLGEASAEQGIIVSASNHTPGLPALATSARLMPCQSHRSLWKWHMQKPPGDSAFCLSLPEGRLASRTARSLLLFPAVCRFPA
jgi:hypothetical protein